MKVAQLLTWSLFSAVLLSPVFAQLEPEQPHLIGRPNPALAGIKKVSVFVLHTDFGVARQNRYWPELEQKVTEKLKAAGIDALPVTYVSERLVFDGEGSALIIRLDTLDIADSQQCVVRIHTSFARMVCLENDPKVRIKTDVWENEPAMKIVRGEDLPGAVADVVMNDVDAFIHAYVAANPPGKQAADANTLAKQRAATREKRAAVPAKTPDTESQFVASRNSEVFHKPDCPSAARIAAANRVTYKTRDDAIAAGKRPCKRCNP